MSERIRHFVSIDNLLTVEQIIKIISIQDLLLHDIILTFALVTYNRDGLFVVIGVNNGFVNIFYTPIYLYEDFVDFKMIAIRRLYNVGSTPFSFFPNLFTLNGTIRSFIYPFCAFK